MRLTFAANMIVRDAEDTIAQCLESIIGAGCFDQIVIALDTRTQDGTERIISEYSRYFPIKLIPYRWASQDFSAARNIALRHTDTEYAFWIDADEQILDADGICEIIRNPQGKAYMMIQLSRLPDGSLIHVPQVRLFPVKRGVVWELPIHEQIGFSLERLNIPVVGTQYRIYHSGYITDELITSKHIRNYPALKRYVESGQGDARRKRYIMEQYNVSRQYLSERGGFFGLGIDPGTVYLIVQIVTTLVATGVSVYAAMEQAKNELNLQRSLTESEIRSVASELSGRFPGISYSDWYRMVETFFYFGGPVSEREDQEGDRSGYLWILSVIGVVLYGYLR